MKPLLTAGVVLLLFACTNSTPISPAKPAPSNRDTIASKQRDNPYSRLDASPMDMAYFPADFAVKKSEVGFPAEPRVRVIYSRPHRGGRQLFGNLLAWGKPWRLGANEATEIEFFVPATIQGKRVEKGRYIMYAIPQRDKWEIVLNRHLYTWGLNPDATKDAVRVEAPAINNRPLVEDFTMVFVATPTGADLVMAWENTEVRLPIQF